MTRGAELDDDVVDGGREARVTNQTDAEAVSSLVAMRSFSKRDDVVLGERIENGFDGRARSRCRGSHGCRGDARLPR